MYENHGHGHPGLFVWGIH